jgi:hypothetical protein
VTPVGSQHPREQSGQSIIVLEEQNVRSRRAAPACRPILRHPVVLF